MTEDFAQSKSPESPRLATSGARSPAVGTNHGGIFTGDTIIQAPLVLPPPANVPAPHGLHNLPRPVGHWFVGREAEMAALEQVLQPRCKRTATHVVTQALSGLGGIGKSTLALHFAHTYQHQYTTVWWIDAETPETITDSLAQLTQRANPGTDTSSAPNTVLAQWALAWLEMHPGWLLVFDNATHPDHLAPHLTRLTGGDHLITSRLTHGWHDLTGQMHPLHLDVLSPQAAVSFLHKLTGPHHEEISATGELASELGYLPLALEQAGAYISRTRITYSNYLHRFRTQVARVLDNPGDGDPHSITIARTWRVTLDTIADRNLLAVHLLRVMAWLAPHDIPRKLLSGAVDEPDADIDALALLSDFSMITLTESTAASHRLVQALARTPAPYDPHRTEVAISAAHTTAGSLIRNALPHNPASNTTGWSEWRTLLPHIDAFFAHTGHDADTINDSFTLYKTSQFLLGQGQISHAAQYAQRSAAAVSRLQGADHPDTLTYRNNLANIYEAARAPDRALPIYEQTLADAIQIHGEDHPVTTRSRVDLARAYQNIGNLDHAVPMFEQILADTIRIHGEAPEKSLNDRANLARAYQAAGNLDKALSMFEQVLDENIRIYGKDALATLTAWSDLARTYHATGKHDKAIPIFEQVLDENIRVLGEAHLLTLYSRSDLAHAYEAAGALDQALPFFQQNLAEAIRVHDEDHPDLLTYRNDLAHAHQEAGNLDIALPMFERVLDDSIRVLGETHLKTLGFRTNLADACRAAGNLDRAIPLYEQALHETIRFHGEKKPLTTMAIRNGLARAYQDIGDLERAIPMYEQTLTDTIRALGERHLKVLAYRSNLADAYRATGNLRRAIPLHEQNFNACVQFHGAEHPMSLTLFFALAGAYEVAGDLDRAIFMYESMLTSLVAKLGENHPATQMVWTRLQQAYAAKPH